MMSGWGDRYFHALCFHPTAFDCAMATFSSTEQHAELLCSQTSGDQKMQISFPGFFLLAISNMQAGKVLGKTSLGTTNKGQHFIQMGDLLFPDILDLQVLQKAGSPENSFPSHASIHWCELGFNTLSVPCIFLLGNSSLKWQRDILEGQSNYSRPVNLRGLWHFQEFLPSVICPTQLFFLLYVFLI